MPLGAPSCGGVAREFSGLSQTHPGSLYHLPQLQTYIGNVLVSVNPSQQLPIYDLEFVAKYRDYTFYELKPHM